MSYNDMENNLPPQRSKNKEKKLQGAATVSMEDVAGTPRSRDHCESVQLGGQASAQASTQREEKKILKRSESGADEDKQLLLVKFI